jgi:NADPH:quinone reductase-like Zn-dependent oxidoreductase
MATADSAPAATMRTIRFHEYGEPADVLRMEDAVVPEPGPGRIRVTVHAVGLNPADWALCRGLFPGNLPRGIGLDVSGTVDAAGEDVTDVAAGDHVFGTADFAGQPTAGAGDHAIMDHWALVPDGLGFIQAAALPMAVVTAYTTLEIFGGSTGQTILIHGAGSIIGYAAVQIALFRGARVLATAGSTYAGDLAAMGATVTSYGKGMAERVLELAGGPVDLVLDTAPVGGALPDLVTIAGGDPRRVMTVSDFAAAAELGVRSNLGEGGTPRYDVLAEFAGYAANGKFTIPVARTFPLADWRTALEISETGHARGKLVLLPNASTAPTD